MRKRSDRKGPRTPEAQFGKDRVLPRRNSGRTAYSRGAIREGPRTPEAQFGKDRVLPRRNSGRTAYFRDGTRVAQLGRLKSDYCKKNSTVTLIHESSLISTS
ncbi:hypothetical protein [Methanosarcina mazei]|uniref:Uncharacterized protein n=1 Tax=Methanosarcina mazei TaxID=2209 RepID=A0A6C0VM02_METMZ|nr:hypothetical protein [Methanosarcina mazei]QIB92228.1 hypothetical protein FQU78_15355 [Methanosarcina mazei]